MKLLEKDEDINKATKTLKTMAHPLRFSKVHKIVKLVKNGILMIIHIYAKVSVYKSV
jgi:hypothetical protein